jgi:hypothetical protein
MERIQKDLFRNYRKLRTHPLATRAQSIVTLAPADGA